MASTSSSSVQKSFKYDVLLSFRGEDTRKTFVAHLYHALYQKGIITYKDDVKIEKGERISEQLMRSIEESRFYIIVFSKNYASSSWCLDELVKIMECQKMKEHTAYPVFYDVEPTEVRHKSGAVGEAFAKHEKGSWSSFLSFYNFLFYCRILLQQIFFFVGWFTRVVDQEKEDDVGRWRNALKEAAFLAGMNLKNTFNGDESKFIKKIVQDISLKLHLINPGIDGKLIGMDTRVKNVVSTLELDSDDIRMIGIKGIGGGGKTTLARAVFDRISFLFEGKSFVENVREGSKGSGLKKLQRQVLQAVFNDKKIVEDSVHDGKSMMQRLHGRKVLVVLDDVDATWQLEALAGSLDWFKPGSRIIITTRDEQVLVAHKVKFIHDINLLSDKEAICLFNMYAFEREIPIQKFEELSKEVVQYAAGLPLTIKVLGSNLYGRSKPEWQDFLERLKVIPLKETLEILELSYNALENDHKEIFLDVACLLKGMEKKKAIILLESCGYRAVYGLRVLEQKSLLTTSYDDRLLLHDHLEQMGRNIVRRLHLDEPNKRSRLWIAKEIEDILVNDSGTEAIRSIKLKNKELHPTIVMKGLKKLTKLRFFHMDDRFIGWDFDEAGTYLPNTLQSLHWRCYPFQCLPKTFQVNKLVDLAMPYSNISQLCGPGERKVFNNLRFVDLSCSYLKTFDLGMTPNLETLCLIECKYFVELNMPYECPHLETLNLKGCTDFVELNMTVVCPKLKFLNLHGSKLSKLNLRMTPNLEELCLEECHEFVELHMPFELLELKLLFLSDSKVKSLNLRPTPNLELLDLSKCRDFVELHMPVECIKLKSLNLSYSKFSNLNLGLTPHLEKLNLEGCRHFIESHMFVECPKLKDLNISGSKVRSIILGKNPHLMVLNLERCNGLVEVRMLVECPELRFLNLNQSKLRNLILGMTPHLEMLNLKGCYDFAELQMSVECTKLKFLNLSGSEVRSVNLGFTPHLELLDLSRCHAFVELHMPVECPKLKFLNLSDSKVRKLNLGMTPHLEELDLAECDCLQEIHAPAGCLKKLVYLNLDSSMRFVFFKIQKRLESYRLDSVVRLELALQPQGKCSLHPNSNLPKFRFNCSYNEALPFLTGNLEKLISFGRCVCTNLESFSASICSLQHLRELTLEANIPEAPKDLWQLESLEKLSLWSKEIKHLPDSICMLKHLKYLDLRSCLNLEQLPMDLGSLENLEELHLMECISLRDIPKNICNMKFLKDLHLTDCTGDRNLPEEVGRLECLRQLNIAGSGVRYLPKSIFQLKGLNSEDLMV